MVLMKKLFGMLPNCIQNFIYWMYQNYIKKKEFKSLHIPFSKKAKEVLEKNGLQNIHPINKESWKVLPVFTQYYAAEYEGKAAFCKVSDKNNFSCIKREAKVLSYINKKSAFLSNISSQLYFYIEADEMDIIVTEYIEGRLASEYAEKVNIEKVYQQLRKVLDELQKLKIIHLDIRPSNIMVINENSDIKIIDYGLSYVESCSSDDIIYKDKILPFELRGVGCKRYNPQEGVFDDAYSVLQTIKDIHPDFKRDYKEYWIELNKKIGEFQIRLKIERITYGAV